MKITVKATLTCKICSNNDFFFLRKLNSAVFNCHLVGGQQSKGIRTYNSYRYVFNMEDIKRAHETLPDLLKKRTSVSSIFQLFSSMRSFSPSLLPNQL